MFESSPWLSFLRKSNIRNKHTLRILIVLMTLNIFISIVFFKQHQQPTDNLKIYKNNIKNYADLYDKELLTTLNGYRNIYIKKSLYQFEIDDSFRLKLMSHSQNKQIYMKINDQNDYLLDKQLIINDLLLNNNNYNNNSQLLNKNYYEPELLINNENICNKISNDKIIITILIHSHRNNFMRRKAMRDTWLKANKINILELFNADEILKLNLNKNNIELVHLFVLGNHKSYASNNQSTEYKQSFDSIKKEADLYQDILMTNIVESYQNLLYKHLTVVNWIIKYCSKATYIIKLDDDVYVNIKPLSRHLLTHLGSNYIDSKFMYCNIVDKAIPVRSLDSKWYVNYNQYPFDYYPRYCEGFSYITNLVTLKLMHQQSNIIPRFWVDDVYVTGMLLYGFERIEWFDYKYFLPVSLYNFWDFSNIFNRFFAGILKLLRFNIVDMYKSDYFVILHIQNNNKEINYDINANETVLNFESEKFYNFCIQLFEN